MMSDKFLPALEEFDQEELSALRIKLRGRTALLIGKLWTQVYDSLEKLEPKQRSKISTYLLEKTQARADKILATHQEEDEHNLSHFVKAHKTFYAALCATIKAETRCEMLTERKGLRFALTSRLLRERIAVYSEEVKKIQPWIDAVVKRLSR